MSRRSVEDWRRAVFKSDLSANVRLLLIYLADHMREYDKHVSVPRPKIAKALGWAEQRVSERLKQAVDAGFLVSKSPGYRGHTAEYQGTWPDHLGSESVRKNRSLSQDQKTGRFLGGLRPENTDATTRADLPVGPHDRDGGSNEEQVPRLPVADLAACQWHRYVSCPEDCANHPDTRREIA